MNNMNYNLIILLVVSCVAFPNLLNAGECPDTEIWRKKLIPIKPDAMKLARVQDCGDYIYVGMYTEAKDITAFMINIVKEGYGTPLFNGFDGDSATENNIHIVLEEKY